MSTEKHTEEGRRVEGYQRLAEFMGGTNDFAIFKRFGALSAENLLYLQAELVDITRRLEDAREANRVSEHPDRQAYAFDWDALQGSADPHCEPGNDDEQWMLMLRSRRVMKEYYEALDLHRKVVSMGRPSGLQLQALKEWMRRPVNGNVYLTGEDRNVWLDSGKEDLVTAWAPDSAFSISSTLTNKIIFAYHNIIGHRLHAADKRDYLRNSVVYEDHKAFKILKALATLIASLLPIVGIVVLYQIQSMPARLGVIAAFTGFFSLCLNLVTTATVKDIFQATATFAAVLVVFVGTTETK